MTEHATEPTGQPRIPGVRYRKETRYREETVDIDGIPETRTVAYTAMVPVPPRDWDRLIITAVTGVAILVTLLAVTGTTASVGSLLSTLVPAAIAYSVAVIFDVTWLACIAVEWLERLDPQRAATARTAGWVALAASMGSVIAFGHHYGETAAGVVASLVSLLAKGLWVFVLRYHAVPLSEPVRFWLNRRRQRGAATLALAKQMNRIDSHRAYMIAAFGPDAARAYQITASSPAALDPTGHATDTGQPASHPIADTTGHGHDTDGRTGQDTGGDTGDVVAFEPPAKAETIRTVLAEDPDISDADLLARVIDVHGRPSTEPEQRKLADTVRRTRQRIEKRTRAS